MKFFKKAAELVISTALVAVSAVNKLLQHRRAGTVFRTVSALMFTVMAVGLFPAASEVALLTADDKNDAVAVGKVEPLQGGSRPSLLRDTTTRQSSCPPRTSKTASSPTTAAP